MVKASLYLLGGGGLTKIVGPLHIVASRIYQGHTDTYPPLLHSVHRLWDFSTSDFGLNHLTYSVEYGRRNGVPVLSRDVRDIMSVSQLSLPHIARDKCSSGRCCFFHMGPRTSGLWSRQPTVNPTTLQPQVPECEVCRHQIPEVCAKPHCCSRNMIDTQ